MNTSPARGVSGFVVAPLFGYLRRAGGTALPEQVRAAAGCDRPLAELYDHASWYHHAEAQALIDAASEAVGDQELGVRVGGHLAREHLGYGYIDHLRSLGSIDAALEGCISAGNKVSAGRTTYVAERRPGEIVVHGEYHAREHGLSFYCGFTAGYYATLVELLGGWGTVIEPECQLDGAPVCRFVVRWRGEPVTSESVASSHAVLESLMDGYDTLQELSVQLTAAATVEAAGERVLDHAARRLVAPGFALIRPDGERYRVDRRGDLTVSVDELVALVRDGRRSTEQVLLADLATPSADHGVLAVVLPRGSRANDVERRILAGFASYARSALDTVLARERAERDHRSSSALLALAQTLAAADSPQEVCDHLVARAAAILDCVVTEVWSVAPDADDVVRVASLGSSSIDAPDRMDASNMVGSVPFDDRVEMCHVDAAGPVLADGMRSRGVEWCAIVRLLARGQSQGALIAGFDGSRRMDAALAALFTGVADVAATALHNAVLDARTRYQATHDYLTGLPNRALLEHEARLLIRDDGSQGAVLFADLDRFKIVNDTLGHSAGDELIRLIGERFTNVVRDTDVVARMSGDEFVVLSPGTDREGATALAERVVESFRHPFVIHGHQLHISCSLGVALWPDDGTAYDDLLQASDAAMYEAKAHGRNRLAVAQAPPVRRDDVLLLEHELHGAIARGQLDVRYQPQVDLHTGRLVGVEALVRWDHPDRGLVLPDEFIGVAIESGLITSIDALVRRRAFADAARWAEAGRRVTVAVNVSTRDLRRADFVGDLLAEVDRSGVPAELIECEITDDVALGRSDHGPVLQALKAAGIRLAVDDFGVGASVLARLHDGPFDTLKIDRSLIAHIERNGRTSPIVKALVGMAHDLDLRIVAEGIEHRVQTEVLLALGCHVGQGFLYSPAVDAPTIDAMLRADTLVLTRDITR